MADTLVDPVEAVPPTQRDPELQKPPPRSSRVALFVLVALFFLGGVIAAVLWVMVFRYKPTARAHVPAGANVVVRIETADIVLFGPVRNRLLPLLVEDPPRGKAGQVSLAKRLEAKSGVTLPLDVREILLASMDGKSWVALFGGRIEAGKFVPALLEIAKEDQWAGFRLDGEVLVGPSIAIAQAEDGTILVGTDRAIVDTALPVTEEGAKVGLPEKGAVTFVVAKPAWESLSAASKLVPKAAALGGVRRGTGAFVLGNSPELTLRLEAAEGADAAAIQHGTSALLSDLGLLLLLAPDRLGEKEALRQAVVSREDRTVIVRVPWPYEGLDRGAAQFAALFRVQGDPERALPGTAP